MRPFPAKETKNLGIWITLSSPWRVVSDKNLQNKSALTVCGHFYKVKTK